MQLKVFFEHIYKPLPSDAFYPNRKNGGILVHYFFQKGGSNHYPCNKHHLISSDVAGERKLYDGTRTLTQQMKESFPSILPEELTIYIEKLLNQETAQKVARNFGIQPKTDINVPALAKALVYQFDLYINSVDDEVSDIVSEAYLRFCTDISATIHQPPIPRYPDDKVCLLGDTPHHMKIPLYTDFTVSWAFQNDGKQTWKNRKLFFSNWNHPDVRPKARENIIDIPTTEPGGSARITTSMNTRGKQGTSICEWIMVDENGENCFPNNKIFHLIITGIWEMPSESTDK